MPRKKTPARFDPATRGVVFVFDATLSEIHQPMAALALLAGLNGKGFTGTAECLIRPGDEGGECRMALFVDTEPDDEWWASLADLVGHSCAGDGDVRLKREECEYAEVGELEGGFLYAGSAGFKDGNAVWESDPPGPDPDSPFTGLCRRIRERPA
ncbi:MAG: hypothetical protein K2W96_20280 [Gemmataceae bacterium]|nr:hypothetical protein [Gemmataceae bacterium]